jgi:hypothetical protein
MRNHDAERDALIDIRSLCAGAGIVLIGRGLLMRHCCCGSFGAT